MTKSKKIKISLSIREEIWKKYQEYCKDKDLIPSFELQRFMEKESKS